MPDFALLLHVDMIDANEKASTASVAEASETALTAVCVCVVLLM